MTLRNMALAYMKMCA